MQNRRPSLLAVILLLWGTVFSFAQGERKPWARRPGVVLYGLKQEATPVQRSALARTLGVHSTAGAQSLLSTGARQTMVFAPQGRSEEEMAAALLQTGAVAYAEPDYLMPPAVLPNDPNYSTQWHHQAIHSPASWDFATGAPSIVVAVCDSGVDAAHPDLGPNMQLPGYNAADHTTQTDPITDHGTAVAGLIDAVGNNGIGGTGVAWNVKVLPVRVTNFVDGSAWCSDMASGIVWAADHGAHVINLSYDITGCPNAINAASQYAKDQGAVTFIAAGNQGIHLPGTFPQSHAFILVGATDSADQRAPFSNYGLPIDLVSPGVAIYSTFPGSTYATGTGTSFSAPIAAGVAALLLSLSPTWTPEQIRTFLLATAQPIGSLNGYGRVDALAAMTAAQAVLLGGSMPILPNTPGSGAQASVSNLDSMVVYPNPWRLDRHNGVSVVFAPLPEGSTVKILTMSGYWVQTLTANQNQAVWDLKNSSGESVATGIYLYSVKDLDGNEVQGKLAVIK